MVPRHRAGLFAAVLFTLLAGCAHERAALPPPVVGAPSDTGRIKGPGTPEFPAASLDTLLTSPSLTGATIAIQVVSLKDGKTLYATNPDLLLTPASVLKLLTSAAALYWLTPQYKFQTGVRWDGRDLILVGGGDPSLSAEDLSRLAREVKREDLGLGRVRNLVVDASYLDTLTFGTGWSPDDAIYPYHPSLSALTCQHNFFTLTLRPKGKGDKVGIEVEPRFRSLRVRNRMDVVTEGKTEIRVRQKMTLQGLEIEVEGAFNARDREQALTRNILNPALFAGVLFKDALQVEGIKIRGKVALGASPDSGLKVLATHRSQALADLLRTMNKESDNLYAELVLKTLGAERFGPPGSADKGVRAVRMFLDTLGVKPAGIRMVDGSGLSRANALSAEVLVRVLSWMYEQFRLSPEFVSTLPVAGEDGTLSRRLDAASRLSRAKTGTLKGVSSLAGYAVNKRGEVVAFAVLVNGHTVPASAIRDLQDEVVKKLNSW